jgi:CheY-like chemotaxis protein
VVWTGHVAIARVRLVTEIGSPRRQATGPQRVRFSFETATLRAAVDAADLLRQLAGCGVQVRPTQPCRLAGTYRWRILVTSPPLEASRLTALEQDMQGIARRAPGIRFTGWLFLSLTGELKASCGGASVSAEALRVLIVDDSAPFRRAARGLLERRGYSVVGEADGAATGLAAIERLVPDAVLLDVRLPDGSGFDLCTLLTRERDAPSVLLVSGDLYTDAALLRDCGARALVAKAELAAVDLNSIWGVAAGASP